MLEAIKLVSLIWNAIVGFFEEIGGLSMRMKITFGILVCLFLAVFVPVCIVGCVTPNEAYITANYNYSQNALPDLIQYIEKDQALSDLDKVVRKESVQEWKKLLEQAYSELGELGKDGK